ncbi:hypothetical protein C7K08_01120 [Synechococcus lacustris str. Tous]|uniref:Uncharacterized protein n=1 Tax=Synechococcus lacustris str. Tous TaxID=1910958 RepID=A0A2P7EHV9_9SYNE|nr:hypothetical protein C7K08_01120 [Synechococcus lacustris str. Tous]
MLSAIGIELRINCQHLSLASSTPLPKARNTLQYVAGQLCQVMLHLQFLEELAQRRRGPIRKRLEPDWRDAGIDLLYSVNRLADMLDAVDGPSDKQARSELIDYTEASIRRLERIRYRLSQRGA